MKQEEDYSNTDSDENSSSIGPGVKVLKELFSLWTSSGHLVCADSYFASDQAVEIMFQEGFKFIGVVKTAHKKSH